MLGRMVEWGRTSLFVVVCLGMLAACREDDPDEHPSRDSGMPPEDAGAREVDDASPVDASREPTLDALCRADVSEPSGRDACYQCSGNYEFGGSCIEPLFAMSARWTLGVMGSRIMLYAGGGIRAPFGCEGTWSDSTLECGTSYSRSGRTCDPTVHVREEPDGSLLVWFSSLEASATCRK